VVRHSQRKGRRTTYSEKINPEGTKLEKKKNRPYLHIEGGRNKGTSGGGGRKDQMRKVRRLPFMKNHLSLRVRKGNSKE